MSAPYRFGRIEVRPDDRQILVDGSPVALGGRAFDLLLALLDRPGRLVTKSELLERAWRGVVVEENNLAVQVNALRKLVGPHAIVTVPGRGYRFELPPGAESRASAAATPRTGQPHSATSPVPPAGNLAEAPSPIYGREPEVREFTQLLLQHGLVSIVGPGGIGKTRLAQAVAHRARERFADGAWLVELGALRDSNQVAATVAHALTMTVNIAAKAFDAVIDALRGKSILVVLDSCEHLIGAASALAAHIRHRAPGATLLVTSQEPLKVADEHVYRLDTLAVPSPGATLTVEAATRYGAVELFVARARAADHRFELRQRDLGAVLDICRRLDGIAMAIELAAARLPLLGLDGLRARLDERFNVLTTGARGALPQHQTLRAALDWSHALLSQGEQVVFRRLAVFVGGFSLDMVLAVVGDETLDRWTVLDHLGALVDKSLVAVDTNEVPRYRLLETGCAYALLQLKQSGEAEEMARRHAHAVAGLFEQSFAERWHVHADERFARYRPEIDNLRAALEWSRGNDSSLEIALAGAAAWLWFECGLRAEGIGACEHAIARLDGSTPPALEARILSEHAQLGRLILPVDATLGALERALALYRDAHDRVGLYVALARRATFFASAGEVDEAGSALAEAESLEDGSWTPRLWLEKYWALTSLLGYTGPVEEFRAAQEQRCHLARLAGSELDELFALRNLVLVDIVLDRLDDAIATGQALAERFRRSGFASHLGYLLADVSAAMGLRGSLDDATRVAREAIPLLEHVANVARSFGLLALLLWQRGRRDAAARLSGSEERAVAKTGGRRQLLQQRLHDDLAARLKQTVGPRELARLLAEGAALSDGDAVAVALAELGPVPEEPNDVGQRP